MHDLNKSGSRFIVLASDGVTNMIKSHELIKLVGSFEERKERGVRYIWQLDTKLVIKYDLNLF